LESNEVISDAEGKLRSLRAREDPSKYFEAGTSTRKTKSRHLLKGELEGALKPKSEMEERAISRDGVEKLPLNVNFLEDVIAESGLPESEQNQLRQMAHLSNASGSQIKRWRLDNITAKYQLHQHDRGSVEVQVAMLCERIRAMREHLGRNHRDIHNRRNLSVLIQRRRKFLLYLRRHNFAAYQRIMLDFRLNERELDTFGDAGRAKMAKPTIRW